MIQNLMSLYLATLFGALVGALLGLPLQMITAQEGWVVVWGAIGANAGATWAALLSANGKVIWRVRTAPATPPLAADDATE